MSHSATQWAWEQRLPPQRKLILMKLADRANKDGYCWPKLCLIATECSMSIRTVQRHIRALEKEKIISIVERYRMNGSQRSNRYLLNVVSSPEPAMDVTPPMTSEAATDTPVSPLEPSFNHVNKIQLLDASLLVWPSHDNHDRLQLLEMLRGVDLLAGQQLLDELEGALSARAIKASSRQWFKALVRSYRRGEFQPYLGLGVAELRKTATSQPPESAKRRAATVNVNSVKSASKVGAEYIKQMREMTTK